MSKKVFIITSDFPPAPGIGSLNVAKLTKYLLREGWEPFVLTAPLASRFVSSSLNLELPLQNVCYIPWPDYSDKRNRLLYRLLGNVGWYFPAVKKGLELLKEFKPNIILASSPHHIAQVIAYKLAKITSIPWVAHLRDPWTIDYHFSKARLTYLLGKLLEKKIFSSASAIIVVSEGFADFYARLSQRPTHIIHNGFDPEDFPQNTTPEPVFTLLFAGSIYRGIRDITPLLRALSKLKEGGFLEKFPIQVKMYLPADDMEVVLAYLTQYPSIKDLFVLSPWTSHNIIVEEESKATYLLLPLEVNAKGWYFYSGKLFEYMGARRPILSIGPRFHLAARLIENKGIGVNCETEEELKMFLESAIKKFYEDGELWMIEWEKVKDFSWENQAKKIGEILEKFAL
ncbi:MAG: glycosyltransferase [bacterium]